MLLAVPSCVLAGVMGPYDEPKMWALVVVGGLTGLVWLARRVFAPAGTASAGADGPLRAVRWTLAACAVWWALATALSIAPGQSLWGEFGRGFGLVVFLATLVLFAIVQTEVTSLDRACRLIDWALIGSVPVVVLALGQALGRDPLPPGWDPATAELRVRSTFGQHIFLGSYLVALIPLGVGRLITARHQRDRLSSAHIAVAALWALGTIGVLGLAPLGLLAWGAILAWGALAAAAWSALPSSSRRAPGPWRIALLGTLLAGQGLILLLSTARGALIGVVAGLLAASAVLLAARRARRAIAILGVSVLALVLLVGALNFGVWPLDRLKGTHVVARLGSMTALREGSPGWVRVLLWEGVLSGWAQHLVGIRDAASGPWPRLRAMVGYGPDTQLLIIDRFLPRELRTLNARQLDGKARYTFDRAHNEWLDDLVTTGAIGALIWLGLVGALILTGVRRLRSSSGSPEAGVRLGCFAVMVGQVVEGLVGIATPMPRALFWIAAAILTVPVPLTLTRAEPAPRTRPQAARARRRGSLPSFALLACALGLVLVAIVGTTRSLLGSMAYSAGIRRGLAGDLSSARREFLRASDLAPWTPFPAEAVADVALRMVAARVDSGRPVAGLEEAQEVLARARQYAPSHSNLWLLGGRVALARVSAGQRDQLDLALREFSEAARLRPGDPIILSQWALALEQSGDAVGAGRMAGEALAGDRSTWLAWAVLARSHKELGNHAQAARSAEEARQSVPPASRDFLEKLLP